MDTFTTRPIKELTQLEFKELLHNLPILISRHAFDHLSEGQRKIFKEQELKDMINKEEPRKIYLQANSRYSAYYRKSDGYRRLIIELEKDKAVIVTFADTTELPKIRLENGKG